MDKNLEFVAFINDAESYTDKNGQNKTNYHTVGKLYRDSRGFFKIKMRILGQNVWYYAFLPKEQTPAPTPTPATVDEAPF